jgi:hypothetical protein
MILLLISDSVARVVIQEALEHGGYGSNGMCENCSVVVRGRFANCLKIRLRNVRVVEDFSTALRECVSSAREIITRPAGR